MSSSNSRRTHSSSASKMSIQSSSAEVLCVTAPGVAVTESTVGICAAIAGPLDSSVDGRGLLRFGRRDLDPAGLGPLGDRDDQAEYAGVVGRLDLLEVEVVPEDQLAAERAAGSFAGQDLPVPAGNWALGLDGQHVPFDIEVDALLGYAGQVELDDEPVSLPPRVHRHQGRSGGGAGPLPGE